MLIIPAFAKIPYFAKPFLHHPSTETAVRSFKARVLIERPIFTYGEDANALGNY
jgi:hypothetical protein